MPDIEEEGEERNRVLYDIGQLIENWEKILMPKKILNFFFIRSVENPPRSFPVFVYRP